MTSKEALDIYLGGNMNVATLTPEAIRDFMVTFAKHHVKEALETAGFALELYQTERDTISNCYPLDEII